MAAAVAKAGDLVPAKARTCGEVTSLTYIADPTDPANFGQPFLIVTWKAEGNGSHLGRYTITGTDEYRFGIQEGQLVLLSTGTWVATGPTGEQLFGHSANVRVSGESTFVGESWFDGGTGRYEGTTGYETTVGTVNPDNTFCYEHEGWVSKVKNNGKKNN